MASSSSNQDHKIYEFLPYKIEKIECRMNRRNNNNNINNNQNNTRNNGSSNSNNQYLIPPARSGHRSVCTDGSLYCLGGFNPEHRRHVSRRRRPSTSLFQELWSFNFALKEWKLCLNCNTKDMPEELASNAVTIKNSTLVAFGGTAYPFGEACSNQCYLFDVSSPIIRVNRLNTSGDAPIPQYGPAIVIHDRYLYTIGGTTGFEYSCDVYRLDLITKRWECIYICKSEENGDPNGRYRHEIVYTGKLIYILGGGTAQIAYDLNILPAYDLEMNCWRFIETKPDTSVRENNGYPGARKCHSCIQYNLNNNDSNSQNGIEAVIVGGYADYDIYYSDMWKLNFDTMQWQLLRTANLPNPIYFHSAATPGNGCMYIFGGIEIQDSLTRTNDLYKVWTTIPKLSEICWDAVCHYNRNLDRFTEDELLKFGIPRKFVSRIQTNNDTNN